MQKGFNAFQQLLLLEYSFQDSMGKVKSMVRVDNTIVAQLQPISDVVVSSPIPSRKSHARGGLEVSSI